MDGLEGNFTRPRQVRYQAALRPDFRTYLILNHFLEERNDSPLDRSPRRDNTSTISSAVNP